MTFVSQLRPEAPDPLSIVSRIRCKLHALWLKYTYPFIEFGEGAYLGARGKLSRPSARFVRLGPGVILADNIWLNVVFAPDETPTCKIALGEGCSIGARSTISAKNHIEIGRKVLTAPSVLIMDHNHNFSDPDAPIADQGVSEGGRIVIEENCWLGYNCVVVCSSGELRIGRNSVVAANSVVTRSIPHHSVVAGNPARIVRTYDWATRQWLRAGSGSPVNQGEGTD